MNKNIKYKKLYDICDFISGGTPLKFKIEYWKGGNIPWVKISDFKEKYIKISDEKITRLGLENSNAKILEKGTILYTIFASIGKVAILDIEATTNQAIVGINLKKDVSIDKDFLYYFLCSIENNIKNQARGMAQNNINISILKNENIPIFSLPFQKKIVKNIKNVENILENFRKKKVLIHFLNKSLFTTMFGNIKTNDKNWEILEIKEVSNILTRGKTPKYTSLSNIFIINQACVYWDRIKYENIKFHLEEENLLFLKNKDILINSTGTGTLGRMNIIKNIINEKFTIDSHVMLLRLKKEKVLPIYFVNIFMGEQYQKELLLKCVNGSTNQIELSKEKFSKFKIPVPPIELQNKFAERIEKIEKLKFEIEKSIEMAQNLYNSLISKYFDN